MLGKIVSEPQQDWDHSSTGFSSNKLFLGWKIRMPLDLVLGIPKKEKAQTSDQNEDLLEKIESSHELARNHIQVVADIRKRSYNVKVRRKLFEVGQWIWFYFSTRFQRKLLKWQKMYNGL